MASPAAVVVPGDLSTDLINQAQRVIDMDTKIAELEPSASPLVVLLKKLRRVQALSPKVEWLEQVLMPRYDVTGATALVGAVTIQVTNGSYFRVGDVIRNTTTGEAMEVISVTGNILGVTRAIGSQIAVAVGLGDEIFIVANVNAEGASLRTIKTTKLTNLNNFCEIVRTPTGITGTEAASKLYGGPDRSRLQAAAGIEHMRDWEHIAFFGAKKEDVTTAGAPKRFAGGAVEYITGRTNAGGALTETTWQTFLRDGFRFGSDRKVFFASPLVLASIEGFARGTLASNSTGGGYANIDPDHGKTFGVAMRTYVSGQGTVDIVLERAWNDSAVYKGYGFLLDLDSVEWHYLRDTKLLENRQANDADKIEDEYLTEACTVFKNEQKHRILYGAT